MKATDPALKSACGGGVLVEGLVAHCKLSRNEKHGFAAERAAVGATHEEAPPERKDLEMEYEDYNGCVDLRRGGGLIKSKK